MTNIINDFRAFDGQYCETMATQDISPAVQLALVNVLGEEEGAGLSSVGDDAATVLKRVKALYAPTQAALKDIIQEKPGSHEADRAREILERK